MKRYPEYKNSHLDWMGKIPKHWQVLRNFAIFADRSDRGISSSSSFFRNSTGRGYPSRIYLRSDHQIF